jgi:hypothetical protein
MDVYIATTSLLVRPCEYLAINDTALFEISFGFGFDFDSDFDSSKRACYSVAALKAERGFEKGIWLLKGRVRCRVRQRITTLPADQRSPVPSIGLFLIFLGLINCRCSPCVDN